MACRSYKTFALAILHRFDEFFQQLLGARDLNDHCYHALHGFVVAHVHLDLSHSLKWARCRGLTHRKQQTCDMEDGVGDKMVEPKTIKIKRSS